MKVTYTITIETDDPFFNKPLTEEYIQSALHILLKHNDASSQFDKLSSVKVGKLDCIQCKPIDKDTPLPSSPRIYGWNNQSCDCDTASMMEGC